MSSVWIAVCPRDNFQCSLKFYKFWRWRFHTLTVDTGNNNVWTISQLLNLLSHFLRSLTLVKGVCGYNVRDLNLGLKEKNKCEKQVWKTSSRGLSEGQTWLAYQEKRAKTMRRESAEMFLEGLYALTFWKTSWSSCRDGRTARWPLTLPLFR